MKKIIKSTLLIGSLLFISFSTIMAQPTQGDPGPPPDDNPVPITGIEYLIAAGAAFGAKKIYDKKKK